ncbi:MAG: amidohydrolase [Actinomycetia bacterium]|nr:amidohydrolase [Actinomycetes bacterium]
MRAADGGMSRHDPTVTATPPVVLRDLHVVGRTGHVDGPVDVRLQEGRITAVGPRVAGDGSRDVDMAGVFAMAGVVDCHTHLAVSSTDVVEILATPASVRTLQAADAARRTVRAGVTFARDAGGADAGLRAGLVRGLAEGPSLQISVVMISRTGGHADGHLPELDLELAADGRIPPPGGPGHLVDSVDDVRRVVRQVLRAGGEWIKLCATGEIASDFDDPLAPELSEAELSTAVVEAAVRGRRVMVHAYGGEGLDNALAAGVASIEHGTLLTERQARRMARQGTFLVPTMSVLEGAVQSAREGQMPDSHRAKTLAIAPRLAEVLPIASSAGVAVALGSDAAEHSAHGRNLAEIAALRRGGLPAHDCLRAATIEGARLLGIDDTRGAIEPGMIADLALLDEDPSDCLCFDRDDVVTGVIQNGRWVVRHPRA